MDLYAFDDDYVRSLCAGDRWTGEHFFQYFRSILLIKLRTRLRSKQDIDDVIQEVLLHALVAICSEKRLRDAKKLGAFVNAICNNMLLERMRKKTPSQLDPELQEVPDPGPDPYRVFVSEETKSRVRDIIASLKAKDARVLRALLEERDKDEICEALGVDRDYLRVLIYRASATFRAASGAGRLIDFFRGRETKSPPDSLSDE